MTARRGMVAHDAEARPCLCVSNISTDTFIHPWHRREAGGGTGSTCRKGTDVPLCSKCFQVTWFHMQQRHFCASDEVYKRGKVSAHVHSLK